MGMSIGYKALLNRVKRLWEIQGDFEAVDLGLGFFLFKFEVKSDFTKVFTGGPWVILDHYLTVRKWKADFKPSVAEDISTAVWVRFKLPIEYYNEKFLFHIAKLIGKPIKVDLNTATTTRGRYARVCVEINLGNPLTSQFAIGKYVYNIEYEHLHLFCFSCGRVGHRQEHCGRTSTTNPVKSTEALDSTNAHRRVENLASAETMESGSDETRYGPWMLVARKPKRPNQGKKPITNQPNLEKNRFGPLQNAKEGPFKYKHSEPKHKAKMAQTQPSTSKPNTVFPAIENQPDSSCMDRDMLLTSDVGTIPEVQITTVNALSPSEKPAMKSNKVDTAMKRNKADAFVHPTSTSTISTEMENFHNSLTSPNHNQPANDLNFNLTQHHHSHLSPVQSNLKERSPDTSIRHGSNGTDPPSHEIQQCEFVHRARDRSNSPSRHRMVGRTRKDEYRTKMEMPLRPHSTLGETSINEVHSGRLQES